MAARPRQDPPPRRQAARHGSATFLGFVVAGTMPLLAYLIPGLMGDRFVIAILIALAALFVVGASRAFFTELRWFRAGAEMFLMGALAAAVAFGIGALGAYLTDGFAAPYPAEARTADGRVLMYAGRSPPQSITTSPLEVR